MEFLKNDPYSASVCYLSFFAASFLILAVIFASGFPTLVKDLMKEIRLVRARKKRTLHPETLESLEASGNQLEGEILFIRGPKPAQHEAEELSALFSEAACSPEM